MRSRAVVVLVALVLAPLGARAADLVVWWEKGFYAQEDEAVGEIVAAFEQETGKQVELAFHAADGASGQDRGGARGRPAARLRLRLLACTYMSRNGPSTIGSWTSRTPSATSRTCSIRMRSTGRCCSTPRPGRRPCTGCRSAARPTTSTSGRACWSARASRSPTFRKEWEAFWSFWCDQVQPAVRQATGPRRHLGRRPADVGRGRRHLDQFFQFVGRLRGGLRDPRRPAGHRRPGDQAAGWSRRSTATRPSTARAAPRPIR